MDHIHSMIYVPVLHLSYYFAKYNDANCQIPSSTELFPGPAVTKIAWNNK